MKGLKISVSGIRGVYPSDLNFEVVYKFGLAYGNFLKEKNVYIGRDTRISGEILKHILISSILATGKNVIDLGIAPTPVVEFFVEKNKKTGGVIVTASHNPVKYNGIKFLSSKGTFLNEKEGKILLEIFKKGKFSLSKKPGELFFETNISEKFFQAIYENINTEKIKESNFKIAVDVCQG
ncbi:MAG: phosphoglucosamine mutase, partial [Candidatus Omnitrophica bacterium]|nr:phosphoglucosamine mutase [Candidatus Omnitrophota bacterium]